MKSIVTSIIIMLALPAFSSYGFNLSQEPDVQSSSNEVSATAAQGRAPFQFAYQSGEKLEYVVSYRAALVKNADMGGATITVNDDVINSQPMLRIDAYATVFGVFRWFFKLDDYYYSWISKATGLPVQAKSEIREGSYRYSSRFTYDWDNMVAHNWWHNHRKPNPGTKDIPLENKQTMDGVTLFYHLRSSDLSSYKPGEVRKLSLLMDDTVRHINYKYYGPEVKNVTGLGEVPSLKFSCQLVTSEGESFEEGTEFFIWISNDPNKIPVYLESPLRVGSVRARLTKYEGLKYPGQSVLK